MNETTPPRRGLRRAGAVFAGFLAIVILSVGTDVALYATGGFPAGARLSDPLFAVALTYRIVYGVIGGYVTARLAPDGPMRLALILGGIGVALSLAGAVAMWGAGPAWYNLGIVFTALPSTWAGAALRAAQQAGSRR